MQVMQPYNPIKKQQPTNPYITHPCFLNIFLLLQYQTNYLTKKQNRKMQGRKLSLSSIMEQWDGQDLMLQVQGNRVVVVGNKRSKIKRSEPGIGLFSRLALGNKLKENRDEGMQEQFVIKAKLKNRSYRVSLADLGQVYNTSRVNVRKQRRISQNLPQYEPKQNTIKNKSNFSNQLHQQNLNKIDNYSKYQTHKTQPKQRRTISEYNCINQNYTNFDSNPQQPSHFMNKNKSNCNYNTKPIPHGRYQNQQKMQEIRQSIQSIRLPTNTNQCPEYASANDRFQNMKRQILEKIVESGQINEVSDILRQIRQAADEIIARHYPVQPALKKPNHGMFSFKDLQSNPPNPTNTNLTLNKISEQAEQKIQGINLPQFKDDAGSISSILSLNGNQMKKDDSSSNNQDFCKIANVFIQDGHQYREDDSSNSIKPIILNQEKNQNDFGEIFKQVKEEQKLQDTIRECANTVTQSHANNLASIRKPQEKPSIKQSQAKPQFQSQVQKVLSLLPVSPPPQVQPQSHVQSGQEQIQNIFKKKQQPCQVAPIQFQAYDLQKITLKPVKIIQNLQQAKKFDPEVTKYTQLKVQYLQTRTRTPEIIKIPSPLRFRRKQEVVKHLVATHLVDKQSKSIEY